MATRSSFRTRRIPLLVPAGLALVALVSACSPAVSSPTPSVSDATSPQASISPEPEAVTEPTLAFGGTCENVLPLADVATFFGNAAPLSDQPYITPWPIETLGGIQCAWTGVDEDYVIDDYTGLPAELTLHVTVLPDDAVPSDVRDEFAAPTCDQDYDIGFCSVGVSSQGLWVHAEVRPTDWSDLTRPAPAALTDAANMIAARVSAEVYGTAVTPTGEWWSTVDCVSLGEQIDVSQLMGGIDPVAGYYEGGGETALSRTLASAGVAFQCPWVDAETADALQVSVYPGSAWDWEGILEVLGTAEPIQLVGAVSAAQVTSEYRFTSIVATDGVNVLEVVGSSADLHETAVRALAALG